MHGLLLIDKPSGITSHDVVYKVRKALQTKDVGHAGTLDPLASGLMVLLIGEGTKLSDYILNGDKAYEVEVQLGVKTDTLDFDGEVLEKQEVQLDPETITSHSLKLSGELELPVPAFSAVKRNGKKLYESARKKQEVELPIRKMFFSEVKPLEISKDSVKAYLRCSKGSYIRAWAAQLGENLKVGGCVKSLRRTYSEPFDLKQAIALEALEGLNGDYFIPLAQALPKWPGLTIKGKDEKLMVNGQISHALARRLICEQKQANRSEKPINIKVISGESGQLLSILQARPFKGLKIKRVFRA